MKKKKLINICQNKNSIEYCMSINIGKVLLEQTLRTSFWERFQFIFGDVHGLGYLLDPRYAGEDMKRSLWEELEDFIININKDQSEAIFSSLMPFLCGHKPRKSKTVLCSPGKYLPETISKLTENSKVKKEIDQLYKTRTGKLRIYLKIMEKRKQSSLLSFFESKKKKKTGEEETFHSSEQASGESSGCGINKIPNDSNEDLEISSLTENEDIEDGSCHNINKNKEERLNYQSKPNDISFFKKSSNHHNETWTFYILFAIFGIRHELTYFLPLLHLKKNFPENSYFVGGRQGWALRVHKDYGLIELDKISTENGGNFRALLKHRVEAGDKDSKMHLQNAEKNALYTSPIIQNEILGICGSLIQSSLIKRIKASKYFSLLIDETTDISHIEQMSFCIRYVDETQMKICEIFLCFVPLLSTTGESISNQILSTLLDLGYLRGQGYDRAAAMSGQLKGTQAYISNKQPKAIYVHCISHSLNLAISDSCKVQDIRNCFGIVESTCFPKHAQKTARIVQKHRHILQ
ncbi:unnamed protein product [Ceutorhynchus assimilis]|uniref:DUF4371 domain-containing protein n=1 Tax=Ceutorhynchus assimilis TaxID=467358 RepID=A0A9N9MWD0_9CUCU|nr:unnamed protein product [Ceutorhynchus assimilis]